MKCEHCGEELPKGALNCENCGNFVKQTNHPLCIVGFALGLVSVIYNPYGITSIITIILCIVGLVKIRKTRRLGKGLAIAGIIVAAVTGLYLIAIPTIIEPLLRKIANENLAK